MNNGYVETFVLEGVGEIKKVFNVATNLIKEGYYGWSETQVLDCLHVACRMQERGF